MTTHIEAQRTRDGWKLKATLGTAAIFAVVIFAFLFRLEAGIIALGGGGVWIVRLWWVGIDAHKNRKLNRRERRAAVGIAEEKYEQEKIVTKQLKLAAKIHETRIGVFFFGNQDHDPTYYPATAGERKILQPQLAAPELPKLDLLKIFTQEESAYAIIGPQRSGKTWQAMHFAYDWLARGHQPVVIGRKRKPGEWSGCKHLFTDDANELDNALRQIVQLGSNRHNGEITMTPLAVFLDDWLWFVLNCSYAEKFMGEAGSVMASANIIIYLILQSDSKDAFGIKKHGAMLKRNYQRLYLKPERDAAGIIIPGRSSGYLIDPGENEANKQPIDLLSGVPRCVDSRTAKAPAIVELPEVESSNLQPGNWQAKSLKGMALLRASDEQIIRFYDEGMTKPSYISKELLGYSKQTTIDYIVKVLARNNRQLTD